MVLSLDVAIIGGGLAGTLLMNSLAKYPQLDVHLYEANAEFKERGAAVGLSSNARRALTLLGLGDVTEKAKGVETAGSRLFIGEGPEAGKFAFDIDADLVVCHRHTLLQELIRSIPKDRVHFNKQLVNIDGDTIEFQDGTTASADLVIGADGIHSNVRKFVLGVDHPAVEPIFAGFWDCRAIVPVEEAQRQLGLDRIKKNIRQHAYVGNDCMFIHDMIDDGNLVCIIAAGRTPPDWNRLQWKQSVSRDWLNKKFAGFREFGRTMLDLLCGDSSEIPAFVQWESAKTPKLYDGSLCMIGDAAHATTPWQGSGLGQAIEDILILSTVLGQCKSTYEVPAALEAYDQTRRSRAQRVVESSRETGAMFCGNIGLSAEELAKAMPQRWEFIHNWDTAGAVKTAIGMFEENKAASRAALVQMVEDGVL